MDKSEFKSRLYMFISAFLILLAETLPVVFVYVVFYNLKARTIFVFWGHVYLGAIYFVALLFLSWLYGGIRVGSMRISELMFAQGFATVCADIIFYGEAVLLAYGLVPLLPMLGLLFTQLAFVFLWGLFSTWLYRAIFPPKDVLVIYAGKTVDNFVEKIKTRRHQFRVAEMVHMDEPMEHIYRSIDKYKAVMLWDIPTSQRNDIFKYCYERSLEIYVMPKISDIILNGSEAMHIFDTPLLHTGRHPIKPEQEVMKRLLDFVLALFLLVVTSPVMLLTALCIKAYDKGPVLYKQVRCTRYGKRFEIYKFRSMIVDAEKGGQIRLAAKGDSRITPVGRVIRKVRIDELPQLINILSGDMSFIGPRPERPEIIAKYMEAMPEFSYRVKVKAGLSGYAQIYGKYNTLPYDKLKLDLYYIEHYSIWLDLKLMVLTLKILFTLESTEGVAQENSILLCEDTEDTDEGAGKE